MYSLGNVRAEIAEETYLILPAPSFAGIWSVHVDDEGLFVAAFSWDEMKVLPYRVLISLKTAGYAHGMFLSHHCCLCWCLKQDLCKVWVIPLSFIDRGSGSLLPLGFTLLLWTSTLEIYSPSVNPCSSWGEQCMPLPVDYWSGEVPSR